MSRKETQSTGDKPEKIVTKYDKKVQRRKEEKERARRDERVGRIIGIALLAVLVCIVASFPIRNYLTVNGTYIKVSGENVSRVEFDYHYQVASSDYINQYGAYLSYFGLDLSRDVRTQMYSDTLTWGDFFEEMAVDNIGREKALLKAAKEEGFTYDVAADYDEYREQLKEAASEAGTTVKEFVKQLYGAYATEARVKPYVQNGMYLNAYVDLLRERLEPAQEEIQEYYDNDKASYDSVDYYLTSVDAELPTEPTELADPVEETEGESEGEEGTEEAYKPSEAEIEAAMKLAKAEADKKEKTVQADGELNTNKKRSAVNSVLRDWLFDDERKAGDTAVIEDSTLHRYYVVCFEKRYLDETPSSDIRVVVTAGDNGQAILDEWKGGDATEESFTALCEKYNDTSVFSAEGGLLEAVTPSGLPEELGDWVSESGRAEGDTAVISPASEENTYVVYYAGSNDPEWILSIRNTLLSQSMTEYMDTTVGEIDVDDPKENLRYLKVRAEEEAAAASEAQNGGSEESGSDETSGESGTSDAGAEASGESEGSSGESK
ncbi:MAG: hypothetical protein HFH87_02535 [Lachnospiraceae bacterium]|nr:hypothetical protein [Lachnospiraceae bacterium]